jgi:HK97 family phage portal protein
VGDPATAYWLGAAPSYAGVPVSETTSLGISAVWRACNLIAGTIASLPLRTLRDTDEGGRQRLKSWLDDPGTAEGQTPFEWTETIIWHLLLHGAAFLAHLYNQGGALAGAVPVHPMAVTVDEPRQRDTSGRLLYDREFAVTLRDGTRRVFTPRNMTQLLGPSLDGLHGMGVIAVARNGLGTTIAADRAQAKMYGNGFLVGGLVTPADDDTGEGDGDVIKDSLDERTAGWEHAGEMVFINRKLKLERWAMSAVDAQFLQSRQFQIEEIARWFGVPPFELMQTEKQTSWGTGIEAQQRGLARGTLNPWTIRVEQRLTRMLAAGGPRFAEFDFAGLERPTPEQEIDLLIRQVQAGLVTVNEARRIRNMPPVEGGDELRKGAAPIPPAADDVDVDQDVTV